MRSGAVTVILLLFAATACGLLVRQILAGFIPSLGAVIVTGAIVAFAAAWPVAQTRDRPMPSTACRECGSPPWAGLEFGFCTHCGAMGIVPRRYERSS